MDAIFDLNTLELWPFLCFWAGLCGSSCGAAAHHARLQGRQKLEEWMSESEGCCTMC